jgi:mannose-6-phosphate isomerase
VQVHPDEESVARLWPGEGSKTEAWFVLAAAPAGRIYAGLRPGVDEKALRAAVAAGAVAECLHSFAPRPGDCLFLPAGTVHAVGGGVLLAEVQQSSDATFRLFDWGRKDARGQARALHVEESLACIDWKAGPVQPVRAEGYPDGPAGPLNEEGRVRQRLVTCRYFHLDYQRGARPWRLEGGRMRALLVLHGRGALRAAGGEHALRAGDTVLLPAALAAAEVAPDGPLAVLAATLPSQRMKEEG